MNLRDQILAAKDLPLFPVEVTEWKDENGKPATVYIKILNGLEREQVEVLASKAANDLATSYWREQLLVRALCDAGGTPLFTAKEVELLSKKNGLVLKRLYDYAFKHNGFGAAAVAAAKKNSSK